MKKFIGKADGRCLSPIPFSDPQKDCKQPTLKFDKVHHMHVIVTKQRKTSQVLTQVNPMQSFDVRAIKIFSQGCDMEKI